ncbi:response regulator transcription factor [Peribacillus tepidiphilus]|jgi:DNA-binding NarL/FixJ family response regulator|uniref:response regulator transcription factor n=1 Tax=Peribacillus tepidiphilus TaxID=2652445 RepID=UPI0035B53D34
MLKLLIVEDQGIVRQGLKMMLELKGNMKVVAEASTGKEAIQVLEKMSVDLVLMDIRMPEMNGIEATRFIKNRWPHIKVLILTTFNDDEYALQALKEGASGFLLKTADADQLIHAVESCFKGGLSLHEEVAAKVLPRLLNETIKSKQLDISLSSREMSIVKLVGLGKTNKEIASELHLSIGTVKNHLTVILQKLSLRDRTQLAIFAVKNNIS